MAQCSYSPLSDAGHLRPGKLGSLGAWIAPQPSNKSAADVTAHSDPRTHSHRHGRRPTTPPYLHAHYGSRSPIKTKIITANGEISQPRVWGATVIGKAENS